MVTTAELESRQLLTAQRASANIATGNESFRPNGAGRETWIAPTGGGVARTLADWMALIDDLVILTDASALNVTATGGTTDTLADWMARIPYDDTGEMIATGTAGRWHIKIGTSAAPITASYPILRIDKYENITEATQPNPVDGKHNAQIVLVGQADSASEIQVTGLWSYQRGGGTHGSVTGADVAAIVGVGEVIRDVPSSAGSYFEGKKNYAQNTVHAIEVRASNLSGAADAFEPLTSSKSMGIWATPSALGNTDDCAAAFVAGYAGSNKWDVGFGVIYSGARTAAFQDSSIAVTSYKDTGQHTDGIDLSGGTYSGKAIKLDHLDSLAGETSSAGTFVNLIATDSSDRVVLGETGTSVFVPEKIRTKQYDVLSESAGAASQVNFYDTTTLKWQIVKHTDNSMYYWSQAAAGIVMHFGAGATRTIGFFGATPVVQQTVGAALSEGGAETNTNLATRINEIRTALVNLGLAA